MADGATDAATSLSGRVGTWLLAVTLRVSGRHAWTLIAVGLVACWLVTNTLGGTSKVPPHYFYIPILFAGVRFGPVGSFSAAVAAAVLSGPMSYAEVATRTPQALLDWGTRGVFFVIIGQALTAIAALTRSSLSSELADLRRAKSLWSAMDHGHFHVYYQPIVSMRDGSRVVGAEALLRLHDPERGTVGPDEFIPLAEKTGMIRPIGAWALREACGRAVRWQKHALVGPDFCLAVNVSARELDAPAFAERVAGVLADTGLAPGCLHLEITETALSDDPRRFIDTLHDLRRLGVGLALDDFGTGHSTLAQVQRLPVDVIKIDRAFVATIEQHGPGSAIAENVLALATSLDLVPIAEGVETSDQARVLSELGCDLAQGYLFGRPVPEDEFVVGLLGHGARTQRPESDVTTPAQG